MLRYSFSGKLVLFVFLGGVLISACGGTAGDLTPTTSVGDMPAAQTPGQQATPVSAEGTPESSGAYQVATFIFPEDYDTFNPLLTRMWVSTISHQLWNCWAWDFDEVNNPRPVLVQEIPSAENGGISADGTVITMKLRPDIVWSDGEPITAADFVFTYQMAVSPNNVVASRYPYSAISGVEAPDPNTVLVRFQKPFAAWLSTLWHGLLPAHVLRPVFESVGNLNNADWNRAPSVGCGPFVYSNREVGSFTRFIANDRYWLGRPQIDEVIVRIMPDENMSAAALKAGNGDLAALVPFSAVPDLTSGGIDVRSVPSGYHEVWYFYLSPENGHPALQDVRVRRAIALALDRQTIVRDLLLGQTEPAITYWDETPFSLPGLQPWPYDPALANQLLDEAGWVDTNGNGVRDRNGMELILAHGTTTRELRQQAQAVFAEQLAQVGIQLDLFNFDLNYLLAGYSQGGAAASGQLDIFEFAAQTAYPDPDTSEWLCSEIPSLDNPNGLNWTRVCDSELDGLFQRQLEQIDFAQRQASFHEISRIIYEQVYMLGIWRDPDLWGLNPRLQNVRLSGVTPFFNVVEWDLNP